MKRHEVSSLKRAAKEKGLKSLTVARWNARMGQVKFSRSGDRITHGQGCYEVINFSTYSISARTT
jgi:hypothetical protein